MDDETEAEKNTMCKELSDRIAGEEQGWALSLAVVSGTRACTLSVLLIPTELDL